MRNRHTQPDGPLIAASATLVSTFGLVFAGLAMLPVDVPVYIPLEHVWVSGFPDSPRIGMDYYGRTFVALLVAVIAALISWVTAKYVVKWNLAQYSQTVPLMGIYSVVGVLLSLLVYCYKLLFK